jgi:hypothetical protein
LEVTQIGPKYHPVNIFQQQSRQMALCGLGATMGMANWGTIHRLTDHLQSKSEQMQHGLRLIVDRAMRQP